MGQPRTKLIPFHCSLLDAPLLTQKIFHGEHLLFQIGSWTGLDALEPPEKNTIGARSICFSSKRRCLWTSQPQVGLAWLLSLKRMLIQGNGPQYAHENNIWVTKDFKATQFHSNHGETTILWMLSLAQMNTAALLA